jgi:hypothetical protein
MTPRTVLATSGADVFSDGQGSSFVPVTGDTLDPAKGLFIGGTTTLEKFVQNQPTATAQATLVGHGIQPVSKTLELDLLDLLSTLDPHGCSARGIPPTFMPNNQASRMMGSANSVTTVNTKRV